MKNTYGRYAVIPTHNRPHELAACVAAIASQVDVVIVVDNASDPPAIPTEGNVVIVRDDEQPPNLSQLWNVGLFHAEMTAHNRGDARWDVAILNDDAVVPAGWAAAVCAAMDTADAVVGVSDHFGRLTAPLVRTEPDGNIMTRECSWALIVRGESGLRSDETMRWWWFDTDFMWRARKAGGTVVIPGYATQNTKPNEWTNVRPELGEQAGRDRARFAEIWGYNPW